MKARHALFALIAAVLLPGYAIAQTSTVVFEVYLDYEQLNDDVFDGPTMEATVSCNAGIPLEQTATVGDDKDDGEVFFTVTEVPVGFDVACTVSFGEPAEGWEYWFTDYDNVFGSIDDYEDLTCKFASIPDDYVLQLADYNKCELELITEPFDFEVTVDWNISPDADVGVGNYAYAILECYNLYDGAYSITTLDAGPDADMPLMLTGMLPNPNGYYGTSDMSVCYAGLFGTGSAVETDYECWYDGVDVVLGEDTECTITATAFYEGVPTLSQYGMAIMVLLMLGMGFVGFRRFV